jgi:iron(III) transport system substrate-binding protein
MSTFNRRRFVIGAGAVGLTPALMTRVVSAAPPAEPVTSALIEAAKKEGRVNYYTAQEIKYAEALAKRFEATYPGISVKVERSGAERIFARIGQEYSSRIHNVDVVNTSDLAHTLPWKRNGWLTAYIPAEVAQHFPADQIDPDGMYVNHRSHLCVIAYNTQKVLPADAPKGFMDLLDPKFTGKMVKAHPGYSGTILTATFQMVRDIGWHYFEGLAKQNVLQVQSAADPPKKIALGERAVMADGTDYQVLTDKEAGAPVEIVYPVEGTPSCSNPNAVFKAAPNPNAARLFFSWLMSAAGQQYVVDLTGQFAPHGQIKLKAGRPRLADLKLMKEDAPALEKQADEIKARYAQLFKV